MMMKFLGTMLMTKVLICSREYNRDEIIYGIELLKAIDK